MKKQIFKSLTIASLSSLGIVPTFSNLSLNNQIPVSFNSTQKVQKKLSSYTTNSLFNTNYNNLSQSNSLSYRDGTTLYVYDLNNLEWDYQGLKPAISINTSGHSLELDWNKIDYSQIPTTADEQDIQNQFDFVASKQEQYNINSNFNNWINIKTSRFYDDIVNDKDHDYKLLMLGASESNFTLTGDGADQVDNYQDMYYQYSFYYIAKAIRANKIEFNAGCTLAEQVLNRLTPSQATLNKQIAYDLLYTLISNDVCFNYIANLPYGNGYPDLTIYFMFDTDKANPQVIECGSNVYWYQPSSIQRDSSWPYEGLNFYINYHDIIHMKNTDSYYEVLINQIGIPDGIGCGTKYYNQIVNQFSSNIDQIYATASNNNNGTYLHYYWHNDGITDGWELGTISGWN